MDVAFQFGRPVYDNGKWMSRGIVYTVETVNGNPTTVPVEGFNPVDIAVSSSAYATVRQAWVNLAQQVESNNSAEWASHVADQKFGSTGIALPG